MHLLDHAAIGLAGLHAVVLGRSAIVGKPLSALLLNADATVTVCHSQTRNLMRYTRDADVLIAAVGRPELVTCEMVKPGAVVIDVGINRLPDGRLTGDVAFSEVVKVASAITPVPGGVGPMTIAWLLNNTCEAYARACGLEWKGIS
jgi:methylenetetrahydrofolate dehydrogenase (NADP+)/methenyltetrahydrofolate cyclohydrolase